MEGYQQFCPVARAAELLTGRWTPLVVRELLCGSVRFNHLHRGVPRMSRTLLSRRLTELEKAGVVERRIEGSDAHPEYHLTRAGRELGPLIEQLGVWGRRWIRDRLSRTELDAGLLMWDVRRRVERDALPTERVVVHFHFTDAPADRSDFWLVLQEPEVDLCLKPPGYEEDLRVTCDVATLTGVWLGDARLDRALRDESIRLSGPPRLRRAFPGWLGLSVFAEVTRP